MATMNMVQALNSAMDVMMARDDNVVVFGEDVGYFGGVFRCTEGLQRKYGPDRAFDTPIAEGGFAGVGVGAAMVGLRPIIEFMTWNFAILAADQIINSAAKMMQMSGGQYGCPIVFRGPNGAAARVCVARADRFCAA